MICCCWNKKTLPICITTYHKRWIHSFIKLSLMLVGKFIHKHLCPISRQGDCILNSYVLMTIHCLPLQCIVVLQYAHVSYIQSSTGESSTGDTWKEQEHEEKRTTDGLKWWWEVALCLIAWLAGAAQHWGRIKDETSNFSLSMTAGGRDTDGDDSRETARFPSSLVECVHACLCLFVCLEYVCLSVHACLCMCVFMYAIYQYKDLNLFKQ